MNIENKTNLNTDVNLGINQALADKLETPKIVDRSTFQTKLDALRVQEKAHTKEGDSIAAARRRLPMVEVDGATPLIGANGTVTLLDAFEGRRMLIAYYFMWHTGHPAPEQCEGCTWLTSQVRELSYIHSRDVTYAIFCQGRMMKVHSTVNSWDGRCLGIQPWILWTFYWLVAVLVCSTSFVTCDKDPMSLKLTGRQGVAAR